MDFFIVEWASCAAIVVFIGYLISQQATASGAVYEVAKWEAVATGPFSLLAWEIYKPWTRVRRGAAQTCCQLLAKIRNIYNIRKRFSLAYIRLNS